MDECTGPSIATWLREAGHEVFSVYDEARGAEDPWILEKALREVWIVVTADKDFGERVFRDRFPHHGIVLLRLRDERLANKRRVLGELIEKHAPDLPNRYVVATETAVRIAQTPEG